MTFDFGTYLSPFTWRYGSQEMRWIWSEANKRRIWREMWVALAEVQAEYGLVRPDQLQELYEQAASIDVTRALEIEAEIHHDLMAELKTFAAQTPKGGGVLHMGATSTDIEDNADVLRVREAMDLVIQQLEGLALTLAEKIEGWADIPIIGFTHLQPAEPSTLGYRLAFTAQDLLMDWENLRRTRAHLRGKGFRGAVGTGASFAELVGDQKLAEFETRLSTRLNLPFYPITTQTYPRKQDYQVMSTLAGLGATLYKFTFDLRILQSPPIGELSEPFGKSQVGSSAMPFKRNPIQSEKIDSLARYLAQMPRLAWDNAAHSLLERTLDDSANRRTMLPEAFLVTDELLRVGGRIVGGLQIREKRMAYNLDKYAPFAATERVLMGLVKAGADRQKMHERLRQHALVAWEQVGSGETNPLGRLIAADEAISGYLAPEELEVLMDAREHVGDAPQRSRSLAKTIRETINRSHG
jgi:adenylosuccinate lyase